MYIEVLYMQLRKAKKVAKDTGKAIPNSALIRSGCNDIEDMELFSYA